MRRFGRRQRADLLSSSEGRCALCGEPLLVGWHADHCMPVSAGGDTDTSNGQALCPQCNLRKGSAVELREWQKEAVDALNWDEKKHHLVVACPGSGKTFLALHEANKSLRSGRTARIVVVCPTTHLKRQWRQAAAKYFQIQIMTDWSSGMETADFHGHAITYQAVSSDHRPSDVACRMKPTFVIFDEIHHAGDQLRWGSRLERAYSEGCELLSLSGTPVRSDGRPISYLEYRDGELVADYSYTYERALIEGVCRPLNFPAFNGPLSWVDSRGFRIEGVTFDTTMSDDQARQRLRTALSGEGLEPMLRAAADDLNEKRSKHHNAAGLVVCADQNHARFVASKLQRIIGEDPVVITSDDTSANSRLKDFRHSRDKWLVSVKMVSEGVNIPRFITGTYATNIRTEVYFRQFCGRLVRKKNNSVDPRDFASVFLPKDPQLIEYAKRIEEEVAAFLRERKENGGNGDRGPGEQRESQFMPLSADLELDESYFQGDSYSADEIAAVRSDIEGMGFPFVLPPEMYAQMKRTWSQGEESQQQTETVVVEDKIKHVKHKVQIVIGRLVGNNHDREAFKDWHVRSNRAAGIRNTKNATLEQLERKYEWLKNRLAERFGAEGDDTESG